MKPDHEQAAKKTYQKPELRTYGSIRELTQSLGAGARQDMIFPPIMTN